MQVLAESSTSVASPEATPALSLRNVDVVFEGVIQVLRSLSLDVGQGQIVALMGGNGAGKTTTLKAISGLLAAERGEVVAGQVLIQGQNRTNADPGQVVREGTIQVMEGRRTEFAGGCAFSYRPRRYS